MRNKAVIVYKFQSCFPEAKFSKFAFRSGELRKILSGLDSYGGTESSGVFPLVLKKVAGVMAGPLASVSHNVTARFFPIVLACGSCHACS